MIYKTCMKEEAQFSLFQYPCFCMAKLIIDKNVIGASKIMNKYGAIPSFFLHAIAIYKTET